MKTRGLLRNKLFSKDYHRSYFSRESKRRKRIAKINRMVIRNWQSKHNGKLPDFSVIPKGYYCQDCPYQYRIEIPKNELNSHVGIVAVGQTHIGGCRLINKTDDDFDGFGLLWDGCKQCGFNNDY